MKRLTVTSKNLKAVKKRLVRVACRIAHERDHGCQFCGRLSGQMHASHCIPRSRGFLAATDTANIIKLCAQCHIRWHEDPTWGARSLQACRPDVARYVRDVNYGGFRATVGAVQEIADGLTEAASNLGIETVK